jgi:DNA-binding transcriptional LysR family regulator
MNFQTIEYFIVLAEERNFTRAASRLYMTQQSLSSHIATVEQELGCELIIRTVPLRLTFAGETFLRYATNYRSTFLSMKHEFCDISQNQSGILRVGISYTRSCIFMPDLISNFQKKRPNIQIEVYENSDLIKQITDGNLDLVITNIKDNNPKLVYKDFYDETIVMVIAKELINKYNLSESDITAAIIEGHLNPLRNCPIIMNESGGLSFDTAYELFKHSDFKPNIKCTLINMKTILELCYRNVGACFSPKNMAYSLLTDEQLSKLMLFPIHNNFHCQIRFCYQKRSYQWSIINDFIQTALEVYPQIINAPDSQE